MTENSDHYTRRERTLDSERPLVNSHSNDEQNLQNIETEDNSTREKWSSKAEFMLSSLGYCVGFGNVWRFHYLCFAFGEAFFIPYLLLLLIIGIPLFFLELAIGQYFSSGVIGVWKSICPLFKGLGYTMWIMSCLYCIYVTVIFAWTFYFMFMSFTSTLPWTTCGNSWNTDYCSTEWRKGTWMNCTNCQKYPTSPSEEFWSNNVLEITGAIGDLGDMRWPLFGTLFLSWIVVYFCLFKGIKSSGKVVYLTATVPFIIMFGLMVRSVHVLNGSRYGFSGYVNLYLRYTDINKLRDYRVWLSAAEEIYWSLGVGFGALITLGSYNKSNNNVHSDAVIIPLVIWGSSIFAMFVVISVFGVMSYTQNEMFAGLITAGPRLAFVRFPEAIGHMPVPTLWAILFFFMLLTLGLDSQFAVVEVLITGLVDEYPWLRETKWRKPAFVAVLCIMMLFLGLPFVMQGGIYWVNLIDQYFAGLSLQIVVLLELIIIGWIYGIDRFSSDVQLITGMKPVLLFRIILKYIAPLVAIATIIATIYHHVKWPVVGYGRSRYPDWAVFLGWLIGLSPVIFIPVMAIHELYKTPGTLLGRLKHCLQPDHTAILKIRRECAKRTTRNYHGRNYMQPDNTTTAEILHNEGDTETTPMTHFVNVDGAGQGQRGLLNQETGVVFERPLGSTGNSLK